jgi:hypothetical protein
LVPLEPALHRRAFLGRAAAWTGGLWAGLAPGGLALGAALAGSRIVDVEKGKLGVTFTAHLAEAPYPHGRSRYDDATTLIFIPKHYYYGYRRIDRRTGRPEEPPGLDIIVHFHGHKTTARKSMNQLELREQLLESHQNAILVVPQGPVNASDSRFGKLDHPGGFERFLGDVRRLLQTKKAARSLPYEARLPRSARVGKVCISAHSGGYKAAVRCAEFGHFPVQEIYLFDALYSEVGRFADWIADDPAPRGKRGFNTRRKLVSFYRPGTVARMNRQLQKEFDRRGIAYSIETKEKALSRQQLQAAAVIFMETSASHSKITCRNDLRDSLLASSLHRYKSTKWFENEDAARKIELRKCR